MNAQLCSLLESINYKICLYNTTDEWYPFFSSGIRYWWLLTAKWPNLLPIWLFLSYSLHWQIRTLWCILYKLVTLGVERWSVCAWERRYWWGGSPEREGTCCLLGYLTQLGMGSIALMITCCTIAVQVTSTENASCRASLCLLEWKLGTILTVFQSVYLSVSRSMYISIASKDMQQVCLLYQGRAVGFSTSISAQSQSQYLAMTLN